MHRADTEFVKKQADSPIVAGRALAARAVPLATPHVDSDLQHLITKAITCRRKAEDLLTQDALAQHIARERLRSDRTGRPFSLVILRIPGDDLTLHRINRLAITALRRTREIDQIGWFKNDALAALLPETATPGARRVADDITAAVARHIPRLESTLYTYPTPPGPDSDASSGHNAPPRSAPAISPISDLNGAFDPAKDDDPSPKRAALPAEQPLAPLLARRLPLWKRAIDIAGASLGLLLASPVLLAAAVAIKLTDRGPILFVQKRAGLAGQPFPIYKLRSMYMDAEARKKELMHLNEQDGPAFKIKNDPRITPIGRFIRKTSIDELPQLLNVLKGEMSLVGPRPPTFDEVAKYQTWYHRRLQVTPGLTCIWQVFGRGDRVSFEDWMRMDARYVLTRSFWQDLKLILGTIPAMVLSKGH